MRLQSIVYLSDRAKWRTWSLWSSETGLHLYDNIPIPVAKNDKKNHKMGKTQQKNTQKNKNTKQVNNTITNTKLLKIQKTCKKV